MLEMRLAKGPAPTPFGHLFMSRRADVVQRSPGRATPSRRGLQRRPCFHPRLGTNPGREGVSKP
jgi:hypothetical protein